MPRISGLTDERLLNAESRAYIVSLLEPVWQRQLEAIQEHYQKILGSGNERERTRHWQLHKARADG